MNAQRDPLITLSIPLSQVNLVLSGLDELPHKYAAPLVSEIRRQTHEQLQPPEPAPAQPPQSSRAAEAPASA